jgi:hypothetical protein
MTDHSAGATAGFKDGTRTAGKKPASDEYAKAYAAAYKRAHAQHGSTQGWKAGCADAQALSESNECADNNRFNDASR